MKNILLLVTLCVGFFSRGAAQQTPWEWVNPLPQGNPLNAVDAITQDSVVAVGTYGTVVRSSNGGMTWQVEPTSGGITTQLFATQFISPSTGWATGESGVVLKTLDGGAGWSVYSAPTFLDLYAVYFVSSSTGWVAGNSGLIFRTTDGGVTWNPQTSGTLSSLYSLFFTSSSTGWASGSDGRILKTTNSGSTWTTLSSNTSQSLFAVNFISSTVGWAVGVSGTILSTVNGGTTWVPQISGTATSLFGVDFVSSSVGWAAGAYGTILKTTDAGIHWFPQTTPTYNDLYSMQFISATRGWVVGDLGTMLSTVDGGTNWFSISSGPQNELYGINFPTTSVGFAVGDLGTILKTTNSGTAWSTLNSGLYLPLYGAKFVNSSLGWVVGDSAVILKTTNGGDSWVEQSSHTDITLYSVDFVSSTIGWAVGDGGTILKTANGGTSWSAQTTPTSASLLRVRFISSSIGYAAGDAGVILKTTNGGTTWTQQISNTTQTLYSIFLVDQNIAYASGDFGTIVATTNGGTTWSLQDTQTDVSLYGLTYMNAVTGWAVGDDGTLIGTTDGGTTWSLQSSGTSNTFYEIQFLYGTTGGVVFAAGAGGTIVCSGISPFPVRTWVGGLDSLWSSPGNWSPVGIPQKLDSVYIPATATKPAIRQVTQQINIAALKIASAAKLSIGPELAQLVVKNNVEVSGALVIDPTASTEIVMGGSFLVAGTGLFVPSKSTIAFTSQGQLKGTFNTVVVNESATVQTVGNVHIKSKLLNLSNFTIRSIDTLSIDNPDPFAFEGGGLTGAGTIKRAILPGSTQPYRFESPVTFLRFYPGGTLPDTVWMTAFPNTLPLGRSDSLFVRRYYTIATKGGSNYKAFMSLRYDTSETSISIDQLGMFQDSSNVLTNMGVYDFLDSDLVAIYLDSLPNVAANWYFGQYDYIPTHPYAFTDSLVIHDNGSGRDTLIFGAVPGASDGLDPLLGESQLAVKPPAGTFDIRWSIPTTRGSKIDILDVLRGARTQNVYTCDLQPSGAGYPMTLEWNTHALTVGSYYLRDSATHGAQFNINMKYQSSFVISNPAIKVVEIVHSVPYYYTFGRRWNMVSLPLTSTTDRLKTSIFPTAVSLAYKFIGSYALEDTLKNGRGYWLKFGNAQTVAMEGFPRTLDTFALTKGWNMVGSISLPVGIGSLGQNPAGIIQGSVYLYSNGYIPTDTIRPSGGYWIKVSQAGTLILSHASAVPKRLASQSFVESISQFNSITVSDNDKNSQDLFFGKSTVSSAEDDGREMPPVPPEGIFDARFNSNQIVEQWSNEPAAPVLQIHSATYPVTIHWHITQPEISSISFRNVVTGRPVGPVQAGKDGSIRLTNPAITSVAIEITTTQDRPKEFALRQNYPNPFNPSTVIEFSLPATSTVSLKVYNVLGQQVASIAENSQYGAGVHSVRFDASNFGSGIYFYRLVARSNSATTFQQVRKMLLIK